MIRLRVPLALASAMLAALPATFAQSRLLPTCDPWQACRALALDAASRGEGEGFHDLAWRTVQLGPPNDPELLWLLARAQAASGRHHDSLVLIRRLAEMGVATTADTDSDFARTRELPGWSEVVTLLDRLRQDRVARTAVPAGPVKTGSTSTPTETPLGSARRSSSPTRSIWSAGTAAPPALVSATAVRDEPLRFSTSSFTPGGLAYDGVSRRFIIGDAEGRRLMVVGVDTKRAVDMVRSDSARFQDVVDIGIDQTRGDLWVTSRGPNGESALHRLQLISGRPLRIYHPPASAGPVRLGDLAVRSGQVVVLDVLGRRLMTPAAIGTDLRVVAQLRVEPSSVTTHSDAAVAYVAHAGGIVRVDLNGGKTVELTGAMAGLERLRAYRDGLVGVQRTDEGTRRMVFLPLRRSGSAVGVASVLDVTLPTSVAPPFLTAVNDEVSYLVTSPDPTTPASSAGGDSGGFVESVIHRIRLR